MKRLLLLLLVLIMISPFVSAAGSPVKTTFQDYPTQTTTPFAYEDWTIESSYGQGWDAPTIYGDKYTKTYRGGSPSSFKLTSTRGAQFTYAAWTAWTSSTDSRNRYVVTLMNSDGATIASHEYSASMEPNNTRSRFEVVISGGTAYFYRDDVLVTTAAAATNPYYLSLFGYSYNTIYTYTDDIILGYESDPVIIGTIPSDWFIMYDATSPASTGLYQVNSSDVSMPILKNSNYFNVTYGRNVPDATTLNVIDPAGNVVISTPVTNMARNVPFAITDLQSDGAIRNGLWRVSLADDAETSYFWVMGSGASGSWSQETYTQGDTATFSYTILDSSWNAGTSTYRFDVLDVYGNVVDTQSITTQTGGKTVTLNEADYPSGVYYGAVIRTTGGEDAWLAADAMEVSAYIKYMGGIYDAESEAQITSNVAIKITQGGITDTTYTTTGVYNSTDGLAFGTGSLTTFTVSASGYQTSNTSFTPMIAKTITKNITLIRSSPTCPIGICLGGLAKETIYSRPVPAVTIAVTNATYGESYSTSTNSVGWYNLGESDGVFLTNGRCYSVTASKAGYTGNTYLKCMEGT